MGEKKRIPLNESYNFIKDGFDSLNHQQSSSEAAPVLFQNEELPDNSSSSTQINSNTTSVQED